MPMPRIFVSHSHHDNAWCRPFVAAMQSAGWDAWYDEKGLQAGAAWVKVIQTELQTREIFLLILTPDAWASEWVQDEVQLALATRRLIVIVEHQPAMVDGFVLTRQWIRVPDLDAAAAAHQVAVALAGTATPLTNTPSPTAQSAASPLMVSPEKLPPHLAQLGFRGEVSAFEGRPVEFILPPLARVTAGSFWMGSRNDPQAQTDEPWHQVTLDEYEIGVYPVTVAEYACAVRAGKVPPPPDKDAWGANQRWADQLQHPDHPVVNVSWREARQYVGWLTTMTGAAWRLPTEAEWEKAARWDVTRAIAWIYPWGDTWGNSRANTKDSGPQASSPVGAYAAQGDASPVGCHDMAGNVWEWTSSIYAVEDYQADNRRENNNDTTSHRVIRGGSWSDVPEYARAAYRGKFTIDDHFGNLGFRPARLALPGSR